MSDQDATQPEDSSVPSAPGELPAEAVSGLTDTNASSDSTAAPVSGSDSSLSETTDPSVSADTSETAPAAQDASSADPTASSMPTDADAPAAAPLSGTSTDTDPSAPAAPSDTTTNGTASAPADAPVADAPAPSDSAPSDSEASTASAPAPNSGLDPTQIGHTPADSTPALPSPTDSSTSSAPADAPAPSDLAPSDSAPSDSTASAPAAEPTDAVPTAATTPDVFQTLTQDGQAVADALEKMEADLGAVVSLEIKSVASVATSLAGKLRLILEGGKNLPKQHALKVLLEAVEDVEDATAVFLTSDEEAQNQSDSQSLTDKIKSATSGIEQAVKSYYAKLMGR